MQVQAQRGLQGGEEIKKFSFLLSFAQSFSKHSAGARMYKVTGVS